MDRDGCYDGRALPGSIGFQIHQPHSSTNTINVVAYLLFERLALLQSETVRLGNNRNDIDNFTEFFHDNHVYRTERMTGWVDKVQAAVDARVLDVTVTHRRELLAEVCAVLVLNILHNWVPAITSTKLLSITTF